MSGDVGAGHGHESLESRMTGNGHVRFGGGSPQKYCPSPGQQLGGGLPNTFISSTNGRADIAQRGHAKNKRFDLRLVGLALACSTDHRLPLAHIATAGNAPDAKEIGRASGRERGWISVVAVAVLET